MGLNGEWRTNNEIVMALVTYILLSTLIAGLNHQFQPELLGKTATISLIVVIVEIFFLKLGCYLLSISSQSQLLDLIAYSGYKFVGIIVTVVVAEILNGGKGTGGWVGWLIFFYTYLANSLFLVSSIQTLQDAHMLTICSDAIAQVCSSPRDFSWRQRRTHADRFTGEAQPTYKVPLYVLVLCAALLYVDSHPSISGNTELRKIATLSNIFVKESMKLGGVWWIQKLSQQRHGDGNEGRLGMYDNYLI